MQTPSLSLDFDDSLLTVLPDEQEHGASGRKVLKLPSRITCAADRMRVDLANDVACFDAGGRSRAAALDAVDERTFGLSQSGLGIGEREPEAPRVLDRMRLPP